MAQSRFCGCGVLDIPDRPLLRLMVTTEGEEEMRGEKVYIPLAVFGTPVVLTLIHDADGHEAQES